MKIFSSLARLLLKTILVLIVADLVFIAGYQLISAYIISEYAPAGKSDAAVIFFENYGDSQGISSRTFHSVMHAKDLYDRGLVSNLICVGGARSDGQKRGSELMCEILRKEGIPGDLINADRSSWDTLTNWKEAKRILSEKGWQSAVLVSSQSHMARILYAASGSDIKLSLSPAHITDEDIPQYLLRIWNQTNHELVAWGAALFLPDSAYARLIKIYRLGGDAVS